MANFNELMQRFVNESYDGLLTLANSAFADLSEHLKKFFHNAPDYPAQSILLLTATCLGADGKLTALEHRFVNDLLDANHSYDSLSSTVSQLYSAESIETVDKLTDSLDASARASLLTLALCLLAVDETITRDEAAFVAKLIAQ